MSAPEEPAPDKETILLHNISPELEKELLRRARANGHNVSREATDIIESHFDEETGEDRL